MSQEVGLLREEENEPRSWSIEQAVRSLDLHDPYFPVATGKDRHNLGHGPVVGEGESLLESIPHLQPEDYGLVVSIWADAEVVGGIPMTNVARNAGRCFGRASTCAEER